MKSFFHSYIISRKNNKIMEGSGALDRIDVTEGEGEREEAIEEGSGRTKGGVLFSKNTVPKKMGCKREEEARGGVFGDWEVGILEISGKIREEVHEGIQKGRGVGRGAVVDAYFGVVDLVGGRLEGEGEGEEEDRKRRVCEEGEIVHRSEGEVGGGEVEWTWIPVRLVEEGERGGGMQLF